MPTKEEIWDKNVAGWKLGMTDKGHASAMKAMDEYAKQQAIAFMNWTLESGCQYSCTDENQWTNINNPYDSINTAQLHDKFIEQQTENK